MPATLDPSGSAAAAAAPSEGADGASNSASANAIGSAPCYSVIYQEQRVSIDLPPTSTVAALKEAIRHSALASVVAGKLMRLISMGRILNDDSKSLADFRVQPGAVIHLVLSELSRTASSAANNNVAATAYIAAATGSAAASAPPVDPAVMPAPYLAPRGFDRLALLGLGPDEISMMRGLYMREVEAAYPPESFPLQPGEAEGSRLRRAEDLWMAQQNPLTSEFAANLRPLVLAHQRQMRRAGGGAFPWLGTGTRGGRSNSEADDEEDEEGGNGGSRYGRGGMMMTSSSSEGTVSSMIGGFCLGFLLGAASLCWLCTQTSARFKQGVIFGVSFNMALRLSGVMDAMMGDEKSTNGGGANDAGSSGSGGGTAAGTGTGGAGGSSGLVPIDPSSLMPIGPRTLLRGGFG